MATMGELQQGMKVRTSDGASLGKIMRVGDGSFLVEKGFFFAKDYEIPIAMVSDLRDGEVWLTVRRDDLERELQEGALATGHEATAAPGQEQRMELSEEELEARKRVREAGEVEVTKEVTTEHRQIEVPVTKEEVHVQRAPASGTAPEGEAFQEQTIRVPVREEEVEVTKKPRVREEVRVSKTPRQEERRVEGEIRREEARVDRTDEGARSEPGGDKTR